MEGEALEPLGMWAGNIDAPAGVPQMHGHTHGGGERQLGDQGGGVGGGPGVGWEAAPNAAMVMARVASWNRSCIGVSGLEKT